MKERRRPLLSGVRLAVVGVSLLTGLTACSRSGVERPVHTADGEEGGAGMRLTSAAFEEGGAIPPRYTCDGGDVSPPLLLSDVPAGTVTLALVMDDPDAPVGTWDHWVAFDMPVIAELAEGETAPGTGGENSWGRLGYGGPCPPGGTHRYFFTVYALDVALGLPEGATKAEVLDAIEGHVLAAATLMGRYGR